MTEREAVSRNLKCLREANGFTQDKLAEYLGMGRSAYSNYESGDREAPLGMLEKLADLYGCDLFSLYEENADVRQMMLATAFRVDNLAAEDMEQFAAFKRVVKNYMKMDILLKR